MPKYRKKPVVIEAEQFWLQKYPWPDGVYAYGSDQYKIDTLSGSALVASGDMIITGIEGEKYPCHPEIFAETYEPVE
jgi:hypothetical protein